MKNATRVNITRIALVNQPFLYWPIRSLSLVIFINEIARIGISRTINTPTINTSQMGRVSVKMTYEEANDQRIISLR